MVCKKNWKSNSKSTTLFEKPFSPFDIDSERNIRQMNEEIVEATTRVNIQCK